MAIIGIILFVLLVAADQLSKLYAINVVQKRGYVEIIKNFYHLIYVENRGAAFGIMQNKQWIFIIITIAVFSVFGYVLYKYKIEGKLFFAATVLILSGGFGNLIDRVFRGYVVDFLQFSFFPPVCNIADYYITVGAVLLVISVMFCKKNIPPRTLKTESAEENTD